MARNINGIIAFDALAYHTPGKCPAQVIHKFLHLYFTHNLQKLQTNQNAPQTRQSRNKGLVTRPPPGLALFRKMPTPLKC